MNRPRTYMYDGNPYPSGPSGRSTNVERRTQRRGLQLCTNIETRRKSKTIANLSPETDRDWDRDFVHATARFRLKVRTYI